MKKLLLIFLMFFTSIITKAQSQHFVYLQTENKQPFYIVLNSVTYNSSASGYMIIPKLTNNTYNFTVGFPKNEFPIQNLSFIINGNDGGYLLKNFGTSGWGLFDLNSMKVTLGSSAQNPSTVTVANSTDDFTKTLSEVVNTDLSSVSKNEVPSSSSNPTKITKQIKLLSNKKNTSGREMVYLVIENNNMDTITVFIPAATTSSEESVASQSVGKNENNKIDEVDVVKPPNKEENKESVSEAPKAKIINADCKNIASDKDFLKLRKLMAAKSTEDGMIKVAEKEFKKRCYSTDNLKNVSMLFFTDKGRYSFFDSAYSHVYDLENFSSLKNLLTDNYYILRFEAMLHK